MEVTDVSYELSEDGNLTVEWTATLTSSETSKGKGKGGGGPKGGFSVWWREGYNSENEWSLLGKGARDEKEKELLFVYRGRVDNLWDSIDTATVLVRSSEAPAPASSEAGGLVTTAVIDVAAAFKVRRKAKAAQEAAAAAKAAKAAAEAESTGSSEAPRNQPPTDSAHDAGFDKSVAKLVEAEKNQQSAALKDLAAAIAKRSKVAIEEALVVCNFLGVTDDALFGQAHNIIADIEEKARAKRQQEKEKKDAKRKEETPRPGSAPQAGKAQGKTSAPAQVQQPAAAQQQQQQQQSQQKQQLSQQQQQLSQQQQQQSGRQQQLHAAQVGQQGRAQQQQQPPQQQQQQQQQQQTQKPIQTSPQTSSAAPHLPAGSRAPEPWLAGGVGNGLRTDPWGLALPGAALSSTTAAPALASPLAVLGGGPALLAPFAPTPVVEGYVGIDITSKVVAIASREGPTEVAYFGPGPLVSTRTLSAPLFAAKLLSDDGALDQALRAAVVTVPAFADEAARTSARQQCKEAGIAVVDTIDEPVAAALAYGLDKSEAIKNVVVLSLTDVMFSVSLLAIGSGSATVMAAAFEPSLSGSALDVAVASVLATEVVKQMGTQVGQAIMADVETQSRFMAEIKRARRDLYTQPSTVFRIDLGGQEFSHPINRYQYQEFAARTIVQFPTAIERILTRGGLTLDDVQDIVLVGSASRAIVESVTAMYSGSDIHASLDPVAAVAIGAAARCVSITAPQLGIAAALPGLQFHQHVRNLHLQQQQQQQKQQQQQQQPVGAGGAGGAVPVVLPPQFQKFAAPGPQTKPKQPPQPGLAPGPPPAQQQPQQQQQQQQHLQPGGPTPAVAAPPVHQPPVSFAAAAAMGGSRHQQQQQQQAAAAAKAKDKRKDDAPGAKQKDKGGSSQGGSGSRSSTAASSTDLGQLIVLKFLISNPDWFFSQAQIVRRAAELARADGLTIDEESLTTAFNILMKDGYVGKAEVKDEKGSRAARGVQYTRKQGAKDRIGELQALPGMPAVQSLRLGMKKN